MKVRREFPRELYGCAFRIVNHGYSSLIWGPTAACFRVGRGIPPTQLRPPASFQALFPGHGIDGAQDEAADAFFIGSHHHEIGIERRIRCGVDSADELLVMVEA